MYCLSTVVAQPGALPRCVCFSSFTAANFHQFRQIFTHPAALHKPNGGDGRGRRMGVKRITGCARGAGKACVFLEQPVSAKNCFCHPYRYIMNFCDFRRQGISVKFRSGHATVIPISACAAENRQSKSLSNEKGCRGAQTSATLYSRAGARSAWRQLRNPG